jgi:hypothetical protein
MKNLSMFIKDEFVKKTIDKLFDNCIIIDTMENADDAVAYAACNECNAITFKNSILKRHFIDELSTARPDINIINCNCSVEKFFDNDLSGFLVFDNLKRCQYTEIIEEIKNRKAILLS